jgi:hypothetical protein
MPAVNFCKVFVEQKAMLQTFENIIKLWQESKTQRQAEHRKLIAQNTEW